MRFVFVESILASLHLQNPILECLEANTNPYHAVLYQHIGALNVTDVSFANADQAVALNQFLSVIRLARESNSALLVSPEYSCPWEVVRSVMSEPDLQPGIGRIWALGCESITSAQLLQLREDFIESGNVVIHFDENVINGAGNFLDPLCYLFKTTNDVGAIVTVCLIQFKTQHMGVRQTAIERDNYIAGDEIYIFRNNAESVYLFTLICSEALIFETSAQFIAQTGHRWLTTPYIILNIQLNPAPNHPDFRQFRRKILAHERKELITLNWGHRSEILLDGHSFPLTQYPGSGFYTDIDGIEFTSDDEFINNHRNGLYYTFYKPKFHIFYLNGIKEVFHVQNSKPFQGNGPLAMQRRNGPRVLACYEILQDFSLLQTTSIEDGLMAFLDLMNSPNAALRGNLLNSFEKERLLCLSAGEIEQKDGSPWFRIDRMTLCILDDNGVINRLTFAQDLQGHGIRTDFLDKIDKLNLIIQDPNNIPNSISFLRGNCLGAMFYNDGTRFHYNFNLISVDNRNKATGAFCGRLPESDAKKKFKALVRLFTDSDQQRKRVVLWYEPVLGTIRTISDNSLPSITDDYSNDPTSIKKVKE
jgi:hypothetical protein